MGIRTSTDAGVRLQASKGVLSAVRASSRMPGQPGSVPANMAPTADFLRLLYAIRAIGAEDGPCIVQFVGCTPQSGTTTIAAGFARAAALQADQRVLLIDCNAGARDGEPTLAGSLLRDGVIDDAIRSSSEMRGFDTAMLSTSANALLDVSVEELRRIFELARSAHSYVILDCSSMETHHGAAALARFCDATILVIEAQATGKAEIATAREQISRLGGRVLGCVLNHKRSVVPAWLKRLS